MKKLLLGLATIFAIGITGCDSNCPGSTCGTIANDGIDGNCYWLEIRNECSGNKKTFCFDQDVWMDAYPGDYFCVYNVTPW